MFHASCRDILQCMVYQIHNDHAIEKSLNAVRIFGAYVGAVVRPSVRNNGMPGLDLEPLRKICTHDSPEVRVSQYRDHIIVFSLAKEIDNLVFGS